MIREHISSLLSPTSTHSASKPSLALWRIASRLSATSKEIGVFVASFFPRGDVEVVGENGESLKMNAVFMREIRESTGEVQETIFFTTLSVARAPQRIVAYYDSRWNIENRCNRTLSQTWKMRTLTSRKLSAICAQIAMVAMCYNVCRIYEEKNPREAEETRAQRCKKER